MSDDLQRGCSNGTVLLLAENALEKLKIADYDVEFCYHKNVTPFSKTYFTEPAANASSQWSLLLSLVSWMIKGIGHEFSVDKYDDPNTSANKLMLALKQLQFEPDFPVSRLKQGYGEAVCQMLDFLATTLLKKRGFKFSEPLYPETNEFEEAEVDDADLAAIEDDIVDEAVEEEEEEMLYSENVRSGAKDSKRYSSDGENRTGHNPVSDDGPEHGKLENDTGILDNEQSPEFQAAWRAELERVSPWLKRKMQSSGNEWRSHLDQVKGHEETIRNALPECTAELKQISTDLSDMLERIANKEALLGSSFENISHEYKQVQVQLIAVTSEYETCSDAVDKLSSELSTVTEALDEVKGDMDSRGNSMVDTSPLQKIRKVLSNLKNEVNEMELRIGIVSHSLLQFSLANAQEARLAKGKVNTAGGQFNGEKSVGGASGAGFNRSPRSPVNYDPF